MRSRRWSPEAVAHAYRDQGVLWTDAEIQARSEAMAREILRMDIRNHNRDRKFYRNEIPSGMARADEAYEKMGVLNGHERLRREDWGRERLSRNGSGALEEAGRA